MRKKHTSAQVGGPRSEKVEEPALEHGPELKSVTTAIHIPESTWKLLRAVAFHRAQDQGGRASVSKLLTELAERHRKELEHELE